MISLVWIIFAGVVAATLFLSYGFVKFYSDRSESEAITTFSAVASLTAVILSLMLIPVDVFSVSHGDELGFSPGLIQILYYALYLTMLFLAFGFIPFSYFYYEEVDEDITTKERIWAGFKYTIFFLVIVSFMLVFGILVDGVPKTGSEAIQKAITFALGGLTILGWLVFLTYTTYGLSSLPITLMKGRKNVDEERSELQTTLASTREQSAAIQSRYLGGSRMNRSDRERVDGLRRRERILERQNSRLEQAQSGCFNTIIACCKPFTFLLGILFMLVTLVYVVSLGLTSFDRIKNSVCGSKCGFLMEHPELVNPVDQGLTFFSTYFPIDYAILTGAVFYIFVATFHGISRIGIRFLWVHMYKVRPHITPAQGLLLACLLLMLALLTLSFQLLTLAPQYVMFGNQTYKNDDGDTVPCKYDPKDDDSTPEGCTMTKMGYFLTQMNERMSFFGVAFYWANWAFLAMWLFGFLIAILRRRDSNIDRDPDAYESDDDEPWERA